MHSHIEASSATIDYPRARAGSERLCLAYSASTAVAIAGTAQEAVGLARVRRKWLRLAPLGGTAGGYIQRAIRAVRAARGAPLAQHRRGFVRGEVVHEARDELGVFVAQAAMLGSMGLLFAITKFGWIGELLGLNGVIAAYLLGGMGVGSFESNLV